MDTQNLYTGSFKKYSIIILILVLIFFIFLEIYLRLFIISIPRTTPKLIHDIYTKPADTVAIGDSQIYRSFINSPDVLNLGRRGMPIPAVKIALNNYIKVHNPSQIIIQASPQLFSQPQLNRGDENFSNYFNLINSPIKAYIFEKGVTQYINSINSLIEFMNTILKPETDRLLNYQYHWSKINSENKFKSVKARVEHHKPIMKSQKSLNFQNEYDNLIKTIVQKNITLCMVKPPVVSLYHSESTKYKSYAVSDNYFNKIAKKYGVKYIKSSDLEVTFSDRMFINQDHLNEDGSFLYSIHIYNACFK